VASVYRKVLGAGVPIDQILVDQFVEGANVCEANGWTDQRRADVGRRQMGRPEAHPRRRRWGAGAAECAKIGCIVSTAKVSLVTVHR
jgi:hypothetical protein